MANWSFLRLIPSFEGIILHLPDSDMVSEWFLTLIQIVYICLMNSKGCEMKNNEHVFQKTLFSEAVFIYESGMVMRMMGI